MKEKEIQKSILDYLRYKKVFCWKNNTIGIYVKARDTYIPSQSAGAPDIFALKDGIIYGIEVKSPKGVFRESQKEFSKKFQEAGGIYILAHSIDEIGPIL